MVTTLNFILNHLGPLNDFWPRQCNKIWTLESHSGYSVKNKLKGENWKQRDQLGHIIIKPKEKKYFNNEICIIFFSKALWDRWTNLKETKGFQYRNFNPNIFFSIITLKCSFSDQIVGVDKIPSWKLEVYASSCFVYWTNIKVITIIIYAPYCTQRLACDQTVVCQEKYKRKN